MTADRTGSQPLSPAPPVFATRAQQSPAALTQIAETVTGFGLPLVILTLPLEFTSDYLKLQLARIVLLVVGVAFAYLVLVGRRRVAVPLSASVVFVAAYVAVSLISWVFTRAPGSKNLLLDVVAYPVTALLIANLVRSETDMRRAWTSFLVSGGAIAVLGALLYLTHFSIWRADTSGLHRINVTFGDPNIAARFLTLAVCAGVLIFAARERPRWLAAAVVAAGAAVIPLTFSKSGYVLFPVSVVIAVPFAVDRRRGAAIATAALLVFAASILVNPDTRDRAGTALGVVSGTSQNGGSPVVNPSDAVGASRIDSVRTYLIKAGWQMFLDHPVAGVGLGGYQHALLTTYRRYLPANSQGPPVTLSHTSVITILAEEGLIGIVLFVGFLLLLAWEVIRSMRMQTAWRNWIVLGGFLVVPILMFSQFEGRLVEEPYLWLALGLLYSARILERSVRRVELP